MSDDGRLAPVPGIEQDTVSSFHAQVAQAARDRAGGWDVVAEVLDDPTEALVARLRDGSLVSDLRLSARWLGADAEMFVPDLTRLDVYARAARRRSADDDLAALRADHGTAIGDAGRALAVHVRELAALCREEADGWAAGDTAAGRGLRARERQHIEEHLVPALPETAGRMVRGASGTVTRTLGRLVLAVLSVESGTDHQRAVLGDDAGGPSF